MSKGAAMQGGPVRDLVGYEGNPPKVVWPDEARIAISIVINYEEGSERAIGDGDPVGEPAGNGHEPATKRALGVETHFEYGARAGFWRLLDVLDEQNVKCTFFASALALERNPGAAAQMRSRGHDVVAHGWRFEDVSGLSREEERDRIRRAVASITKTTGARPVGWASRYGASVNTRELLVEEGGFSYDCDALNDDLPYFVLVGTRRHLVVPYSLSSNDERFERGAFGSPVDFERHLKAEFDWLYREGATRPRMMNVGLHLRTSGHPARAHALSKFIEYAKSHGGVWFARRGDIAQHWIATMPDTVLPSRTYPKF